MGWRIRAPIEYSKVYTSIPGVKRDGRGNNLGKQPNKIKLDTTLFEASRRFALDKPNTFFRDDRICQRFGALTCEQEQS